MNDSPIMFRWTGDSFAPLAPRWQRECDKRFTIGERYALQEYQERSGQSHAHYFACLKDAWLNLPEPIAERFPSVDHLRRYALIKAGYCDSRSFVCSTKAETTRLAAFLRSLDEFSLVGVDGCTVTLFTAKSQSYRAMDKRTFQESKDKVLDVVAGMIGTTQKQLEQAAA